MAVQSIELSNFLGLSARFPVLDVRSPGEYAHAHIPGAYSLPLFTDEERAQVGTAYKQESREQAIKIGLDFYGPKMRAMVEQVEALKSDTVLVHCWRGGMRSAGVAWLLDLYGFKVFTLQGGYKSYRQYIVESFQLPASIKILAGYTGSAKTAVLEKLQRLGEPVINLEKLANHKGSAFGHIGLPTQPSQEMFENLLGTAIRAIGSATCWLEDESWRIGSLLIPQPYYQQMRMAPCYFVDIPFEERLNYIMQDYGTATKEELIQAVLKIQKRLGGLETKTAVSFLVENNIKEAFRILLQYYDKFYRKGLLSRPADAPTVINLEAASVDPDRITQLLLTNQ
ncbi:tRNA 2-selenouridine(34) synthase MnmH [Flavihumibacter cheonanensis]|uniref:tRNA 2-selenouridine(34) synthase MnmH n=1 Tax=Flavihumibacter cheonanensis TaxID=1442385 RepID=UPI001EF84D21|nr:tRNA 2-selenouridine(34) synthase MnmH [Flavihumibacter cheonanensis]MCG7752844.1 tRNA 2-selenouridine(34) synthase MnmH [Flavihumibacter cheonanensis]